MDVPSLPHSLATDVYGFYRCLYFSTHRRYGSISYTVAVVDRHVDAVNNYLRLFKFKGFFKNLPKFARLIINLPKICQILNLKLTKFARFLKPRIYQNRLPDAVLEQKVGHLPHVPVVFVGHFHHLQKKRSCSLLTSGRKPIHLTSVNICIQTSIFIASWYYAKGLFC
jgi:hypothetical protein